MFEIHSFRAVVNERLAAAAEEILGVFERTVANYEEEVFHCKKEINRQRKILDTVLQPEIRLQRLDSAPLQLLVCEEEVHPEQQERSPSLLQSLEQTDIIELTLRPVSVKCEHDGEKSSQLSQTQDPELLQIKDELPQGLEEADSSNIIILLVKCEDSQENILPFQPLQTQREKNREAYSLPSTSTEQMKTEPDGEDCGVSEPASNLANDLEPTRDWPVMDCGVDSLQLLGCEEKVHPEQQEKSSSLGQEDSEPLQIKEEQEELRTSQKGEQLQGLEEADILKLTSTPVPVKSEHDEEIPQSSWFNQTQTGENREAEPLASTSTEQMKTEPDGEDCGVLEPASNLDPVGDLEPTRGGQLLSSDCSGTETEDRDDDCSGTDDSDDWKEIEGHQSGLKTLKSKKTQKRQRLSNSRTLNRSMESSHELKSSSHILSTLCCKVCGTSFHEKMSLMLHIQVHSSDCGLCGKHLDPTESLKLHLEAHRTCTVCGKGFTTNIDIVRHMIYHNREKPFICMDCGKGFEWKSTLQRHMRIHPREKPCSCSVCGKGFRMKGVLRKHMRTHTAEKTFSCSVCGKGFSRNGALQIHMRLHTGEKPFSCSVCGDGFNGTRHLKTHMRSHMGEKPFSCSVCGKGFSRKGYLPKHIRTHTGEKPFCCSVCGKGSGMKGDLKRHMRTHTGEKPFCCSVCGKGFSMKGDLKRHMRTHTGEKPFSCSVCGKGFSRKTHMQRHFRSHTAISLSLGGKI